MERELDENALDSGLAALIAAEPAFGRASALAGPLRLRHRPGGYAGLLGIVAGQQVSVASAAAVFARLEAAGLTQANVAANAPESAFRACGLTRQKAGYAAAIARAGLDWAGLARLPDPEARAELVALPGIGVWSAEIYLMFCLRRRDVFAAGDLALKEAARRLFGLPDRPEEPALRAMADAWSPWRTVAATLLWQFYAATESGRMTETGR